MKATRVTLKVRGRTFTMFVDNYPYDLRAAVRIFLRQTVIPSLGIKAPAAKDLFNT